jgi:hypothetical protein
LVRFSFLAIMSWLFFPGYHVLSFPGYHVLAVLSWLSCPGCLSCFYCNFLTVPSGCSVLVVLSCQSSPGCRSCLSCPKDTFLFPTNYLAEIVVPLKVFTILDRRSGQQHIFTKTF